MIPMREGNISNNFQKFREYVLGSQTFW